MASLVKVHRVRNLRSQIAAISFNHFCRCDQTSNGHDFGLRVQLLAMSRFLTCNPMVAYSQRVMDEVFKALADESRRKLLDQLHKNNGQTLGELCEHLDMTRQAVTKHLVILEAANLVVTVWRGREKLHYLNPVPLHEISERWIGKYERHRLQALSDLKKGLEENKNKKS
jgi:DNA-binding transcriptional ArsR family regulator